MLYSIIGRKLNLGKTKLGPSVLFFSFVEGKRSGIYEENC